MDKNAPITLQTDASDYGIGGYLYETVDSTVQVIMRLSIREKECYGIFYSFKVLEDMLKHKNLVYINCGLTGKVAR